SAVPRERRTRERTRPGPGRSVERVEGSEQRVEPVLFGGLLGEHLRNARQLQREQLAPEVHLALHERLERAVTFGLEEALVTNALEHAASGEAALREVLLEPAQECLRVVQRGDACLDGLGLLWGTQGGAGAARTGRLEIARRGFRGLFGRMARRPRGRTPDLARGRASR